MKKKVKIIIIIICLVLIILEIRKLSTKKYTITYSIDDYQINEVYQNKKYYLIMSKKKNTYIYPIEESFNKNKKIIKNIREYKSNNVICILPTYRKSIEKNIYCTLDNQQVSNDYLIKTKNSDFQKIQKQLKKEDITWPSNSTTTQNYKKMKTYQKNIDSEDIYYIWNYKGIDIVDSNKILSQKFLESDLYDNILATSIKNYYVLLENTSVNGIKKIYYYDYKNSKLKTMSLKEPLSKDIYINGVVDNIIYLTDKKEKKQYTLNISKKKLERIDQDETTYIIYENGEKKELSKSDFFMKEQYFTNNKVVNEKITTSEDLRLQGDYYYFLENNKIYKVLKTYPNHKILLLELDNIKEWNLIEDKIILLQEDTIYTYQEQTGLRIILQKNELKYNYKDIYKIGKK